MLNFNQLDTKESSFSKSFNAYLIQRNKVSSEVSQLVSEIILKIRNEGDNALKDLTKKFDGFDSDLLLPPPLPRAPRAGSKFITFVMLISMLGNVE